MQTTLGEKYPEIPEAPAVVKTKRITDVPVSPTASHSTGASHKPLLIGIAALCLVIVGATSAFIVVSKRNEAERRQEESKRAASEAEAARRKAEAEEQAKAEAKAISQAKDEAVAKAVAQAKADVIATAAAAAAAKARQDEEAKAKAHAEKLERLKGIPSVWALWEEQDRSAIKFNQTRDTEAVLIHKSKSLTVKHEDMPDWLRTAAITKHKDDGESQGLIREVSGKTFDLRNNPAGWVVIPRAVVIQIIDDGYLMMDERALNDPGAPSGSGVFKLLHNGFSRIFTKDTRMQVRGMSVGTYTYRRKAGDTVKVPVYDPGMPIGPLAKTVVPMEPQ